jgi:catechol 2,3-dioxygenase-like lactoylglutathione lyase family enzyme
MATFSGVYLEVGEWPEVVANRDFYRDTLGMTVASEEEGESVWFEIGGTTFGFHVGDAPPRDTRWAINVVLNADDGVSIDDEAKRLEAAGIKLFMGPTDMPWGARVITFLDPAGFAVWYCQRLG